MTVSHLSQMSGSTPSCMFFLTDHLGSVRVVADENGNVRQVNQYYPYGELIEDANMAEGTSDNRYRFTGKELATETGLYDFCARYLETSMGRFTTIDPLAEKYPSVSPYAYCAGDPVNRVDPDGANWYSRINDDGEITYKYVEGQMSKDDQKKYRYTDLGYSYVDRANNKYYSLFGNILPITDSNGQESLEFFLYQHIDNLITKYYTSLDGAVQENFYSGTKASDYGFSYNGQGFHSETGNNGGTIYRSLNNANNSSLHIRMMPPNKSRRFGGYFNAPSWYGCFMILSNSSGYDVVQVNFDEKNASSFRMAINRLFSKK